MRWARTPLPGRSTGSASKAPFQVAKSVIACSSRRVVMASPTFSSVLLKSIQRYHTQIARQVNRSRSYDSPRRREQADATRRAILAAAIDLFTRQGYAATSVAAIAKAAGVSDRAVYLAFENKRGLIRAAWHRALRGDRDDTRVGDQAWFREVVAEPDPAAQLRLNARNGRAVKQRAAALMDVIREAASSDPEVARLWRRIQREFHANQRSVVELLAAKG